jgi:tetratricopeptide (TPR) repeat protein
MDDSQKFKVNLQGSSVMNLKFAALVSLSLVLTAASSMAQIVTSLPTPTPEARVSDRLSKALDEMPAGSVTSRELREQAYAKLLEGQRHIWTGDRLRSMTSRQNNIRLAKRAFQESVSLDPNLSESYTALAELAINGQPQDADEAISLAQLSVRTNPDNFGARRILARLYTFKSRINTASFNSTEAQKAIAEWRHVVRLDPRNAEAWALLSELYDQTGKTEENIDALQKWISASAPVETRFYQMLMGGARLTPETASLKLGAAFLKAGRVKDAIETLSALVAEDPRNFTAVDMLREAVENASPETAGIATASLKQAVQANPANVSLINLLAGVYARSGKLDDARKLLQDSSERIVGSDRKSSSVLQSNLGDLLAAAHRTSDAIMAYERALELRELDKAAVIEDGDREFATGIFGKMIQVLKAANRMAEARNVILRARKLLGAEDLFADRELISLLRESGSRTEALEVVRGLRARMPSDHAMIRLEATLLTETGKVDEGVALIRKLIDSGATTPAANVSTAMAGDGPVAIAVPPSDAFSNHLFVSNLYTQANRGKDAIDAANKAYEVARGTERKQIARLTLATAQHMSGDLAAAEATLRELLRETPGNPIALNNLGYFLLDRDDRLQEAFGLIQQAVKIDPTNPSYLDSLGWAYFRLGKLTEAEKYLKDALRIDSSSGTIHEHLGDVYQKQGKKELARASWERAVSLFSDSADIARVKNKLAR